MLSEKYEDMFRSGMMDEQEGILSVNSRDSGREVIEPSVPPAECSSQSERAGAPGMGKAAFHLR